MFEKGVFSGEIPQLSKNKLIPLFEELHQPWVYFREIMVLEMAHNTSNNRLRTKSIFSSCIYEEHAQVRGS